MSGVSLPRTEFVQLLIGHWDDPATANTVRLKLTADATDTLGACLRGTDPSVLNASDVASDCLSSTVGNRSLAPCGQCATPTSYGAAGAAEWDETVCFADCGGNAGGTWEVRTTHLPPAAHHLVARWAVVKADANARPPTRRHLCTCPLQVDACGSCVDRLGPFAANWNTDCLDCAGVTNGNHTADDCGSCLDPMDPVFNGSCADCAGAPNGLADMDVCGHCLLPASPAFGTMCLDCAGLVNGLAKHSRISNHSLNATNGTYDTTFELSAATTIADATPLTFSTTVTTAAVDGAVVTSTAVTLAAANPDVVPGQVVTGAGIAATVTVASTTGTCTGSDDGSATAPSPPVPCTLNGGSNGCAVLSAGNNCVYAVTDLVLDSAQSISDTTTLTFEIDCALWNVTGGFNEGKMHWTGDYRVHGGDLTIFASTTASMIITNPSFSVEDAVVTVTADDRNDAIVEFQAGSSTCGAGPSPATPPPLQPAALATCRRRCRSSQPTAHANQPPIVIECQSPLR